MSERATQAVAVLVKPNNSHSRLVLWQQQYFAGGGWLTEERGVVCPISTDFAQPGAVVYHIIPDNFRKIEHELVWVSVLKILTIPLFINEYMFCIFVVILTCSFYEYSSWHAEKA